MIRWTVARRGRGNRSQAGMRQAPPPSGVAGLYILPTASKSVPLGGTYGPPLPGSTASGGGRTGAEMNHARHSKRRTQTIVTGQLLDDLQYTV